MCMKTLGLISALEMQKNASWGQIGCKPTIMENREALSAMLGTAISPDREPCFFLLAPCTSHKAACSDTVLHKHRRQVKRCRPVCEPLPGPAREL